MCVCVVRRISGLRCAAVLFGGGVAGSRGVPWVVGGVRAAWTWIQALKAIPWNQLHDLKRCWSMFASVLASGQ